jgi:23S rRNA (guanosine2251-2'-O)-methyltransferase
MKPRYPGGPSPYRVPGRKGRLGSPTQRPKKPSDRTEQQIVFGVEPIRELLAAAPRAVRTLYVRERDRIRFAEEIEHARAGGAQVEIVDDAALSRLAGPDARHQGIVAVVREYNYASLEDILANKPDPIVVVDGVTDPRNLGAIMRSAECAGVEAIVIARDRTSPVTPAAIKSSAGAWAHLKIARCGNVARTLEDLKEAGYWVVALTPDGETSLYEIDTARRIALVVGAEGRGVRDLVAKTADFRASIPMRGRVDSLNVAVATAVALFEIARRRGVAAKPG